MEKNIAMSKNDLVQSLHKAQEDFTLDDIITYIKANGIEMVNFMYPAADGRLKTLNFVINDLAYLETILTLGERVDGSSLFPLYFGRKQRLVCAAALQHGFPRPLCRDSDGDNALLVL